MWKRLDEPEGTDPSARVSSPAVDRAPTKTRGGTERSQPQEAMVGIPNIGQSVVIKGELTGSENLQIDGRVEGTIDLRQHELTIGPGGKIKASVRAKSVVVVGKIVGDIMATDRIEIRADGTVEGDLTTPVVGIAEGGNFRGNIDMRPPEKATGAPASREAGRSKTSGGSSDAARVAAPPSAGSLPRREPR